MSKKEDKLASDNFINIDCLTVLTKGLNPYMFTYTIYLNRLDGFFYALFTNDARGKVSVSDIKKSSFFYPMKRFIAFRTDKYMDLKEEVRSVFENMKLS